MKQPDAPLIHVVAYCPFHGWLTEKEWLQNGRQGHQCFYCAWADRRRRYKKAEPQVKVPAAPQAYRWAYGC